MSVKIQHKENQSGGVSRKIETVSGKLVDPTAPDPADIDLHDIAWGLSRISRFAGHTCTPTPYNVAQHSVHVSELAEMCFDLIDSDTAYFSDEVRATIRSCAANRKGVLLKALLHDAHETYTGDIPSPIKNIPAVKTILERVETELDDAIYTHFNLSPKTDAEKTLIKFCDKVAQAIEADSFMLSKGEHWNLPKFDPSFYKTINVPQSSTVSYSTFIERYSSILNYV